MRRLINRRISDVSKLMQRYVNILSMRKCDHAKEKELTWPFSPQCNLNTNTKHTGAVIVTRLPLVPLADNISKNLSPSLDIFVRHIY